MQSTKFKKQLVRIIIFSFLLILSTLILRWGILANFLITDNSVESVKITDRNGVLLYENISDSSGYSNYLKLEEINPRVMDGIIAVEDKRFYSNFGVDLPRLLKCGYESVLARSIKCGASTITQQYIKNKLHRENSSLITKSEEIVLSFILESTISKDQILEKYLNSIYFSNLRYGVESASFGYLGKSNKDLDIAEISLLISIPNSPVKLDPYNNYSMLKDRQRIVLETMEQNKVISTIEKEAALSREVKLEDNVSSILAPHFVGMLDKSSVEIKTTLDANLYQKSIEIVNKHMDEIEKYRATNASAVILDAKTGEILTLIGSKDYFADDIDGKVNTALSLRNPGSTLKPFTYSLALKKNMSLATQMNDKVQIIITSNGKNYIPENYDKDEHGWVNVREALANSFNIPAVMTLKEVGVQNFYNLMDQIGLEEVRSQDADIAATLGGTSINLLELTNAYRIFANQGHYFGGAKSILKNNYEDKPIQLFENEGEEIAFLISDVLGDNDAKRYSFGSLSSLNLPFPSYSKTGTSQDFRDSWTIGYTKQYVIGVWVGNNDNSEMDSINGIQGAGKIWRDLMILTHDYYLSQKNSDFEIIKPSNIVSLEICKETGEVVVEDNCSGNSYREFFMGNKTPDNPEIIKKLGIRDENEITITDPFDGDTIVFQDDLIFPVKFRSNKSFGKYRLMVDEKMVGESDDPQSIGWKITRGEHVLEIVGVDDGNEVRSNKIKVTIE